jgi:hypothetical protein
MDNEYIAPGRSTSSIPMGTSDDFGVVIRDNDAHSDEQHYEKKRIKP